MKRYFALLTVFALISWGIFSGFKVPSYEGFVTDYAGVLSQDQKGRLSALSEDLKAKTGVEVATLVVPDIEDESIESVEQDVFDHWKIGQKGKDNGVLLIYAVKQKKMRIGVGYGLEGVLPDGKAGRIRDEFILPFAHAGRLAEAIENGHNAVISLMADEYKVQVSGTQVRQIRRHQRQAQLPDWLQGILLVGLILFLWKGRGWLLPLILLGGMGGGSGGNYRDGGGFSGFGGGGSGGGGASGDW